MAHRAGTDVNIKQFVGVFHAVMQAQEEITNATQSPPVSAPHFP